MNAQGNEMQFPALVKWFLRVVNIHKVFMYMFVIIPPLVLAIMAFHHQWNIGLDDVLVMCIFFIPALVQYLAIKGLVGGKAWGRVLSAMTAILMVFFFPVGTVVGIFMLSQLFRKDWRLKAC